MEFMCSQGQRPCESVKVRKVTFLSRFCQLTGDTGTARLKPVQRGVATSLTVKRFAPRNDKQLAIAEGPKLNCNLEAKRPIRFHKLLRHPEQEYYGYGVASQLPAMGISPGLPRAKINSAKPLVFSLRR